MSQARRLGLALAAAFAAPAAAGTAFITEQSSGGLSVVDLDAGEATDYVPLPGGPAGVAVGRDGVIWVTAPEGPALHAVDPTAGTVRSLALEGGPFGVAINPVSGVVYVTDWYGDRVFLIEDGVRAGEIATGRSPSGVAVTPDGTRLLTADRDSDQVSIFDAATHARIAVVPVGVRPFGVTIDAAGRFAYTADVGSDSVSVVDIAAAKHIASVPVGARPYEVALAQGLGFVTNSYGDSVSVFDLATHQPLGEIPVGEYPEGIEASADGTTIYVANWFSNSLSVIDVATRTVLGEIAVGDGPRAFGDFIDD